MTWIALGSGSLLAVVAFTVLAPVFGIVLLLGMRRRIVRWRIDRRPEKRDRNPMAKADEYRKNAAEMIELAHRAGSTKDKGRLLALAEAWRDLADRAEDIARQQTRLREHPLIAARFRRQPQA